MSENNLFKRGLRRTLLISIVLLMTLACVGAASAEDSLTIEGFTLPTLYETEAVSLVIVNYTNNIATGTITDANVIDRIVTSSNPSVGTISNGRFIALAAGTTTVSCNNGVASNSTDITVQALPVTIDYITVYPQGKSVNNSSSPVQFSAIAWNSSRGTQISDAEFTWTSDNDGTIDSNGLFTPNKVGSFTITATNASITNTSVIRVNENLLTSITLSIPSGSSTPQTGQSFVISAAGLDSNGQAKAVNDSSIDWIISGTAVSETGSTSSGSQQFTADTVGSVTIKAKEGTVESAPVRITVTAGPVAPVGSVTGDSTAVVNDPKTYTFTKTGGTDVDSYEWSIPPYGAEFVGINTSSSAVIRFTEAETYTVGVKVTNTTYGYNTYTYSVTVTGSPITPTPTQTGGGGGSGGSGGSGTVTYNEYPRSVTDGGHVSFGSSNTVSSVDLPKGVSGSVVLVAKSSTPAPSGKQTYSVFEINIPNYPTGKEAIIQFHMTLAELEKAGYTAADICLYHCDSKGVWTKLPTTYTVKGSTVYYEAVTTAFSPFAIVYEKGAAKSDETIVIPTETQTQTPQTTETGATPAQPTTAKPTKTASPIGLAGLIGGLLGAAVVLRRK